jgi:hypothetical protein
VLWRFSAFERTGEAVAGTLRRNGALRRKTMPVVLLALFLVLLLYDTRGAFVALALAIVLLYRGRVSGGRRNAHRPVSDISDGSI